MTIKIILSVRQKCQNGGRIRIRLRQINQGLDEMQQAVHGWLSTYERLVNSQYFFSSYLTQEDFCRLGSNASVKIRTGELPALIQEMEENALDIIYIINRPFHFAKWQKHYEKQEHIVFVCRPDHPLAGQEEVTLREIAGHKMVLADSGSTTSYIHELHQAFDAQGLVPDCMLEISNTAILKSMVLDGIGLTFLPYFVVRQEVEAGQLTILPVRELCPELWLQVFSVRGKWISPAMEWFPEEIKKR